MIEQPADTHADSAEELVAFDAVETALLGRPVTMGRREVSREAHVSLLTARRFWHAMGFQVVQDEEAFYTEADLTALRTVATLVRHGGLDEDLAIGMTRAFARSADRLAVWQTQLVAEHLTPESQEAGLDEADARSVPQHEIAQEAATLLVRLADEMEPLLAYVWRRHLVSAIGRMLADSRIETAPSHGGTAGEVADPTRPLRVIGFADLVNFTSLVRRMTERQLASLVQRFELLASDIVTAHGGRVIKTVGDEILFVHTDPAAGAAIALDLVDAVAQDDMLPDVRAALAWGRVVSRLGDVFGTTVNRASRLTSATPKGRVWVDDELAKRLDLVSGFTLTPQRRRILRGIGPVTPSRLRRARGVRGPGPGAWHP